MTSGETALTRKLAAILYTDVAGYSRLTARDEEGTHRILNAALDEVSATVQDHGGRVLHYAGDAVLAEFPSVVVAVQCAQQIQQALAASERFALGEQRLSLRMGINFGDVIADRGELYGDGVNIAARLENLAPPGGICISGKVLAEIKGKLELEVRDLGLQRFKNIAEPVPAYQLLDPAAASVDQAGPPVGAPPDAFARPLSSFVGREHEIANVFELLSKCTVLSLVGAGGCGKTRLAWEVGGAVQQDYPDGVFVVELATLSDPALVTQAVAAAIGIRERTGRTLLDSIGDYLGDKTVLLIWDNCEHLLGACRELASALLRTCGRLRLLVTSRESPRLPGETVYRVSGLSLPDARASSPRTLARSESVRLFIERATQRLSDFSLTADNCQAISSLCRQLDGIPLAIELAASRVTVLSVEQIAERLQDRFNLLTRGADSDVPHQQTLRTTMDWSYGLLTGREAALLNHVSVCAGGFTLEAAEAIHRDEGSDRYALLDLLQQLVEKSLVNTEAAAGSVRYALLETVREYGREQLERAGDLDTTRARHADCYLALAEAAEKELHGTGSAASQASWLDRLELEQRNFRAALAWAFERSQTQVAIRLSGALWRFWEIRGYQSEGRHALQKALGMAQCQPSARAKALNGAGRLAWRQGDFSDARALFEQSLALCRQLRDEIGAADALHGLSRAAVNLADYAAAESLGEQSRVIQERHANRQGVAAAVNTLGECARARQDFTRAETLYHQALTLYRELGDRAACDTVLYNLGIVVLHQGDSDQADALLKESLADASDISDQCSIYSCLDGLAGVAVSRGALERAAVLLSAAETVGKLGGYVGDRIDQEEVERFTAATRAALGEQAFRQAWLRGRALSTVEAIALALD